MRRLILVLCVISFNAAAMAPKLNWDKAVDQAIYRYGLRTEPSLRSYFLTAGIAYPPKEIALLAFKHEQKIELWAQNPSQRWVHVHDYRLTAFSGRLGPKLKENDGQIPEGIYRLVSFNPFSSMHLSLMINYPNEFDKRMGQQEKRSRLGNNIFLHGKNVSVGCLAVGDAAIDQLFTLSRRVGLDHIRLIIAPNDLRKQKPKTMMQGQPIWLSTLYRDIQHALREYV